MRRWLIRLAVAGLALFAVSQAVPYGRDHSNPPVTAEPKWDSARTRDLAVRACFDCHSNQTTWPWYSNIAPVSWLTEHDVTDGRAILNFSEWGPASDLGEAAEAAREGEMPPWYYKPLHPRARLSAAETDALVAGLVRTLRGGAGR